ncbi:MAG: GNAT family N-acetyltransferase [Chthoniobacterales bacterium]
MHPETELVRLAAESDLRAVSDIYNHFVRTSTATFQVEPESLAEREEWFSHRAAREPVTALSIHGEIVAWGALSLHRA